MPVLNTSNKTRGSFYQYHSHKLISRSDKSVQAEMKNKREISRLQLHCKVLDKQGSHCRFDFYLLKDFFSFVYFLWFGVLQNISESAYNHQGMIKFNFHQTFGFNFKNLQVLTNGCIDLYELSVYLEHALSRI